MDPGYAGVRVLLYFGVDPGAARGGLTKGDRLTPTAERPIHWAHTPAGACARKDSQADRTVFTQENGTRIISTAEATHAANVTCPSCQATNEFGAAKKRQDEYWAQEEAEAQEWFDWLETPEGKAWEGGLRAE